MSRLFIACLSLMVLVSDPTSANPPSWFCPFVNLPDLSRLDSTQPPFIIQAIWPDGMLQVQCEKHCSPGTTAMFYNQKGQALSAQLTKKTGEKTYEALALTPGFKVGAHSTDYEAFLSFKTQKTYTASFWAELNNHCQTMDLSPRILLMGERAPGEIKQGDFVQLMLQSGIDQYMALLEIDPQQEVIVWYPHDTVQLRQKITAGVSPLTFDATYLETNSDEKEAAKMSALIRTGMVANPAGASSFIVLMSDEPKPLSDWLPDDNMVLKNGVSRAFFKSWQVGPGYFNPKAVKPSSDMDANYLDCRAWSIGNLKVEIKEK